MGKKTGGTCEMGINGVQRLDGGVPEKRDAKKAL